MNQIAESLNCPDHAPHAIGSTAGRLVNGADRPPGGLTERAQERTVVTELEPQSFGYGEDELPVGDIGTNVFGDPAGFLQGPFLVATRTNAAATARKRDKHLVLAL